MVQRNAQGRELKRMAKHQAKERKKPGGSKSRDSCPILRIRLCLLKSPFLKPVLVAQIEFLEWTAENHLRHTKFVPA